MLDFMGRHSGMRGHSAAVASLLLVGFLGVNALGCVCLLAMPAAGAPDCDMGMPDDGGPGVSPYYDCCRVTCIAESWLANTQAFEVAALSALQVPVTGLASARVHLTDSHPEPVVIQDAPTRVFILTGSLLI